MNPNLKFLQNRLFAKIYEFIPFFVTMTALIFLVEFTVSKGWISSYLLPAPSNIFQAYIEFQKELQTALFETSTNSITGYLISLVVAQSLAFGLNFSVFLRRAILPLAIFFQTVPVIAIAPLLVIWFGFGSPTVCAAAALVSFFPLLSSAIIGYESTHPDNLELFQSFGANQWQTVLYLKFPSGLKINLSGMQTAAGLAVVGAIVGEFIAGSGLGAIIDTARTQQRVDLVFAALILSSALAFCLLSAIRFLQSLIFNWRPFSRT